MTKIMVLQLILLAGIKINAAVSSLNTQRADQKLQLLYTYKLLTINKNTVLI